VTPSTEDNPEADQAPEGGVHEIQRVEGGRFAPGFKPPTAITTSERGRELRLRRMDKAAQEARKAIVEAAQAGGISANSPAEAWGAAVGEVYKGAVAIGTDRPHDAARSLAFVGKATELMRPQERNVQQVALQQVVVTGGRSLETIEGEWEDGTGG
jgi:hypothetical protein